MTKPNDQAPLMGINVASDRMHGLSYADLIVDGHKALESRDSDTLRPYVGKRVAIVRTRSGPAKAIGEVTIGQPMVVNKKKFRSMEDQHLVPEGSAFDITTPTKHLYPMHDPVRYEKEKDVGRGIKARKVINMAKGGKVEVRPTVFDDAASRRNPNIEAAALAMMKGELKQKAYAKLVAKEKPVKAYDFIPKPATDEQAMDVLLDRQKQNWKSHNRWPAGRRVGLRLDIPAYERYGVWVNSVHDEEGSGEHKLPNSYGPVSSVRNATFEGSPDKAIRVATGEQNKNSFARIKGELEHIDEDQAVKHFQKYMNHPDYRQVGYDPRRHGDFYDRETMQPITHSEHVVQIGPLVLAKNPKYGKPTLYAKGGDVNKAKFLAKSKVKERLYHGTTKDFGLFSHKHQYSGEGGSHSGSGFYFTDKPESASRYSMMRGESGSNVMPVHLNIKKPLHFDWEQGETTGAKLKLTPTQVRSIMLDHPKIKDEDESPLTNWGDIRGASFNKTLNDAVNSYAGSSMLSALRNDFFGDNHEQWLRALHKATGYDSGTTVTPNGERHYIAWFPEQIKSAIGNRGTYDPTDPDITKKRGGRVTHAHHLDIEERPL